MAETLTLQLDAPIRHVAVLGGDAHEVHNERETVLTAERQAAQKTAEIERRAKELEKQFASRQAELNQTAQALQAAGNELAKLRNELVGEMQAEAVKLALDIAGRILHQEIQAQGYDIDPIVTEALSRLPRRGEITVRLNPADFERSRLTKSDDEQVRFLADPNVPAAGCVVSSTEGNVETSPETSMNKIQAALTENA